MNWTLCSTYSAVISKVSKCSILPSFGRRGPFMIPSLTNAFLSSSSNSCSNSSLLSTTFLWTRKSQLKINEQSSISSSGYFNALRALNTNYCPFTLIVSSPLSRSIRVIFVVRNDLPKRIDVFSSVLKSMIIKSVGNTNLSILTRISLILRCNSNA